MEILMNALRQKIKSHRSIIFLICCVCFGIISCEKDANVRLPKIPTQLVIVSFISPQDTILRVEVTLSQPLYNNAEENKYRPVEDALVTISSELGSGTLIYDPVEKYYKLDSSLLKVREGKDYTIHVSTPDGKVASATTRIPAANNTFKVELLPDSTLRTSWMDPPETEDFYRVFWQNSSYYLFQGYNQNGNFSDTIYTRYVVAEWYPDTEAKNGGFSNTVQFYRNSFDELDTYIYLLHVSREYYDYHKKLELAQNSGGNPFSEPVPMYSNVKDGFGIFAGYNMVRVKAP